LRKLLPHWCTVHGNNGCVHHTQWKQSRTVQSFCFLILHIISVLIQCRRRFCVVKILFCTRNGIFFFWLLNSFRLLVGVFAMCFFQFMAHKTNKPSNRFWLKNEKWGTQQKHNVRKIFLKKKLIYTFYTCFYLFSCIFFFDLNRSQVM
jgi:hypothetical protein